MSTAVSNLEQRVDARTLEILARRRQTAVVQRRGWLVRRALLGADLVGLIAAFAISQQIYGFSGPGIDRVAQLYEYAIFFAFLPAWIVMAKLYGLYERDEERTDHTTVEDMVDVFHLVTVGVWLLAGVTALTNIASPGMSRLFTFWAIGIALVAGARVAARGYCRRHIAYLQNTLIVGAGDVGQLMARKLLNHNEYGLNLVGFIDEEPKERPEGLESIALVGTPDELPAIVRLLDIERVIFAFSNDPPERTLELVRSLDDLGVQIDIVPRLFEIVTPSAELHMVEGLPVLSLPPVSLSRSSRLLKRALDLVVASTTLVLLSPLLAFIAWRVRRTSPGPILFRQTRLGMNQREFTVLKFRTMTDGTSSLAHQEYIRAVATAEAGLQNNGLFKLERDDVVTPSGRWLRKASLDELPQLLNVLRGEMSLVGPRPCMPYELEHFLPHHYERFAVPAGITGMWQVMARAHSTFREALDMDVSYVRSWSVGLDLRLLCRTPLQLLRSKATR